MTAITRRAVLAGAPAVAAAAVAMPAISGLGAPDPIAGLGRRWLAARERWRHWSTVEDETRARSGWGSSEHKEATRLFRRVQDEMHALEGMITAGQATTFAGLLARWEIIEWLGVDTYPGPDPKAVAMRADLERLAGGVL